VVEREDETEGIIDSLIVFFQVENEERDLWRDVRIGGDILSKVGAVSCKNGCGSEDDMFFFLFFVTKEDGSFNIIFLRKKVIMDSLLPISCGGDLHIFSRIRRKKFPFGCFILPFRYQSGMKVIMMNLMFVGICESSNNINIENIKSTITCGKINLVFLFALCEFFGRERRRRRSFGSRRERHLLLKELIES